MRERQRKVVREEEIEKGRERVTESIFIFTFSSSKSPSICPLIRHSIFVRILNAQVDVDVTPL